MKALIYGAGLSGRQVYKNIKDEVQVIGFLDGDPDKKGHVIADGLPCYGGAESLSDMEFDRIYIASRFWKDIKKILTDNGVSEDRIRVDIPLDTVSDVRNTWLYSYAKAYKNTKLSVAEGVYSGGISPNTSIRFFRIPSYIYLIPSKALTIGMLNMNPIIINSV